MPEFDPHASIRKLAEAERECPACGGTKRRAGQFPNPEVLARCPDCDGAGYIVPFAALRTEHHTHGSRSWCSGAKIDGTVCPGWVPEPDVEKACNRAARIVQELEDGEDVVTWWYDSHKRQWYWNDPMGRGIPAKSYEEAVFCAAEA